MKIYQNIEMVDLRNATAEALIDIAMIKNIGLLLTTPEQNAHIGHIKQSNIGDILTVAKDTQLISHNGDFKLSKVMLQNMVSDVILNVNGSVIVEPIEEGTLLNKIVKANINGTLYITEKDQANFYSNIDINGDIVNYESGDVLLDKNLTLNDDCLFGFHQSSSIVVESLLAIEPFDVNLFKNNISKIRIVDELITTKEILKTIAPVIVNYSEVEKTIVPEGYQYFNKMKLDKDQLRTLKSDKIFVKRRLEIKASAEEITSKISKIICNELVLPEEDMDQMMSIVEKVNKIKIFDPNAINNMSSLTIDESYLEQAEPVSIVNYGALKFEENVLTTTIQAKISNIENYGAITCSALQYSAVFEKTKNNYGVIQKDAMESQKDEFTKGYTVISNIQTVVL